MNDHELDALVRQALRHKADDTDTSPAAIKRATPVAPNSKSRTSWTNTWLISGAALAVAASVLTVAVLTDRVGTETADNGPASQPEETSTNPSNGGNDVPEGWRKESWGGLTIAVPGDWGYGGAPASDGVACYPEAMITAAGGIHPNTDRPDPYVGRPIGLTDVCLGVDALEGALGRTESVWLGAGVEVGIVDLGAGWVRETVEAHGETLTVTSADPALRQQILDSAQQTTLCEPGLAEPPTANFPFANAAEQQAWKPDLLRVCAYQRDTEGEITLTYAAPELAAARPTYRAFQGGGTLLRCADDGSEEFEWVVLDFTGDSVQHRISLVTGGTECPRAEIAPDRPYELTQEMVSPWAKGGIPAVVYGPTGGKGAMIDGFIGPRG